MSEKTIPTRWPSLEIDHVITGFQSEATSIILNDDTDYDAGEKPAYVVFKGTGHAGYAAYALQAVRSYESMREALERCIAECWKEGCAVCVQARTALAQAEEEPSP